MARPPLLAVLATVALTAACAGARSSGFPPPVRPGITSPTDAQSTFRTISGLMEARGVPVLMADTSFGVLRTEWIEWGPGEIDITEMADCETGPQAPMSATRARFLFEVRKRANRAFVTIASHWQMEKYAGFDDSDRGFVDCRSTGEWERLMEETLLQRQVIR